MIKFETNNLEKAIKDFGGTLKDPQKTKHWEVGVKAAESIGSENLSFEIGVQAAADISLFNSKGDRDADYILGPPAGKAKKTKSALKAGPQIEYDGTNAYLKYGLKCGVSGRLAANFLEIGGQKQVILNSYRVHDPEEKIKDAILSDLKSFRFAVKKEDVLNLKKGEALAMQVKGQLDGNISLRRADIFTGILSRVLKSAGINELLKVDVGVSEEVTFKWSLTDDFALVFSRIDEKKFRIVVKKAKSRSKGEGFKIGVNIDFIGEAGVDKLLDDILNGRVGEKLEKVKEIIGEDRIQALRSGIKALANIRAKVGFQYEYNRIGTDTSLLEAVFHRDAVDKYHKSLIKQDLGELLDDIKNKQASGVLIEQFLNEKTLKIKEAWGFSLGLGKWSLSGNDFKEIKYVTRQAGGNLNESGDEMGGSRGKQISFLGVRGYEDKWWSKNVTFKVDFNAQMNDFSKTPEPGASEFDYGIALIWEWQNPGLRSLPRIIDHAVLWKAVSESGKDLAAGLKEELKGKKKLKITCHLRIDPPALKKLLPLLAKRDDKKFATSLAAAMPWWKGFPVRESVARREEAYKSLWEQYFQQPGRSCGEFAKIAGNELEKRGAKDLAYQERVMWGGLRTKTFAGLISVNQASSNLWNVFCRGAEELLEAIDPKNKKPYTVIETCWEKMNDFWEVGFHVRAFGHYLLNTTADIDFILEHSARSFRIDYMDGGAARAINLAEA